MSKSSSRKATKVLAFRMTPDEAIQLRAVAEFNGIGPTTFARRAAFEAASLAVPEYERKLPDPAKADMGKILGQLGRLNSNLNQLAKIANTKSSYQNLKN